MQERDSQSILSRSIDVYYPGAVYQKIVDVIGEKKPFDCWMFNRGTYTAIEVKIAKKERFSFSQVKDHQIKGLMKTKKNEGNAFVSIHWYQPRKLSVFTFIDINDFLYLMEHWPMKSIKLKELVNEGFCHSICMVKKSPNDKGRPVDYANLSESWL